MPTDFIPPRACGLEDAVAVVMDDITDWEAAALKPLVRAVKGGEDTEGGVVV